jgi:hypothetical protein
MKVGYVKSYLQRLNCLFTCIQEHMQREISLSGALHDLQQALEHNTEQQVSHSYTTSREY